MILAVDDSEDIRKLFCNLFGDAGIDAEIVESAETAVERARDHIYNLIIMDIVMPHRSGISAAAEIRSFPPPHGNVPIIAITARQALEDDPQLSQARFDAKLIKPFLARDLFALLERFGVKAPA